MGISVKKVTFKVTLLFVGMTVSVRDAVVLTRPNPIWRPLTPAIPFTVNPATGVIRANIVASTVDVLVEWNCRHAGFHGVNPAMVQLPAVLRVLRTVTGVLALPFQMSPVLSAWQTGRYECRQQKTSVEGLSSCGETTKTVLAVKPGGQLLPPVSGLLMAPHVLLGDVL